MHPRLGTGIGAKVAFAMTRPSRRAMAMVSQRPRPEGSVVCRTAIDGAAGEAVAGVWPLAWPHAATMKRRIRPGVVALMPATTAQLTLSFIRRRPGAPGRGSVLCFEQGLQAVTHLVVDAGPRAGRVQAHETLWLGSSQAVVGLGHLAVEIDRLLLHPVLALAGRLMPAKTGLHRSLEQKGDVGLRERRGPHRRQTTRPALVGQRRVVIAVGDDDLPGGQGRGDGLRYELATRRHEEIHLGFGVDLQALVEQHLADLLAQLGASGFADYHRVARGEPLAEQLGLRRLARALRALERDEQPPLRHAGRVTKRVVRESELCANDAEAPCRCSVRRPHSRRRAGAGAGAGTRSAARSPRAST